MQDETGREIETDTTTAVLAAFAEAYRQEVGAEEDVYRELERATAGSKRPPAPKPAGGQGTASKKPAGPITYTVTKGSDVFWPSKRRPN